MVDMYSKYDNMQKNGMFYALIYINNHIITCIKLYIISSFGVLKLFKCLASNGIHTITEWLDLLFNALHKEKKKRKERIMTKFE